jgi:hypothetical protein
VRSAVDRGIHVAGYGAFGYDRVDRRFVPNEEAPYVVEAFERRAPASRTRRSPTG